MYLLTINLGLILISLFFLRRDSRQFFWGCLLTSNLLLLSSIIVYRILAVVHSKSIFLGNLLAYLVLAVMILFIVGSGVFLMKNSRLLQLKEGRSLIGKVVLLFGGNLIFLLGLLFIYTTNLSKHLIYDWLKYMVGIVFLIDSTLVFFFALYLLYSFFYQKLPVKKEIQYIIVLGAGIRSEEVTPLLKSRLDKGLTIYREQSEQPKFVVSGGQGADEPVSEAYAMKKYLLSQEVPDEKIIMEDQSTTTLENMAFSKEKIFSDWDSQLGLKPTIIFSTNNYHVFRGALYARKVKLQAEGVGAPTAFYFLPSALLREFIAMLVIYKGFFLGIVLLEALFLAVSIFI